MISFKDVSYTYPSGYEALQEISFEIAAGDKVAIIGENGSGKSTLLLHLNGILQASKGSISINQTTISNKTLIPIRQKVGVVFQNPEHQLFMPTVEEDVAVGPINMKLNKTDVVERVEYALKQVDALHLRDRQISQLSGGQKKTVAIATVLAMDPEVLVMDEPTSNLDHRSRRNIMHYIGSFEKTCIIATHDVEMVWELCSHVLILQAGRILAYGSCKEVLSDQHLMQLAGLDLPWQVQR